MHAALFRLSGPVEVLGYGCEAIAPVTLQWLHDTHSLRLFVNLGAVFAKEIQCRYGLNHFTLRPIFRKMQVSIAPI